MHTAHALALALLDLHVYDSHADNALKNFRSLMILTTIKSSSTMHAWDEINNAQNGTSMSSAFSFLSSPAGAALFSLPTTSLINAISGLTNCF